MIKDKEYSKFEKGIFKPYFGRYIEFKRSKGEKVARSTLISLRQLNNLLNQYDKLEITNEMIEEILSPKDNISPHRRKTLITNLRQFSEFLQVLQIPSQSVSSSYYQMVEQKFKPYIFSKEDIRKLLCVTDKLPKANRSNHHIIVYPVLIRILVGTGMRISEVLALKVSDIDRQQGIIKVTNSKNNVSRLIPLSDSLIKAVNNYLDNIINQSENSSLFISPYTQKAYSYDAIKYMFQKNCKTAGIYTKNNKLPNIHSLRHTFCTYSLEQMLENGMDVYSAIPILAAYVGHVNLIDTERYIHFTNIHYQDFIEQEKTLGHLVPEVQHEPS